VASLRLAARLSFREGPVLRGRAREQSKTGARHGRGGGGRPRFPGNPGALQGSGLTPLRPGPAWRPAGPGPQARSGSFARAREATTRSGRTRGRFKAGETVRRAVPKKGNGPEGRPLTRAQKRPLLQQGHRPTRARTWRMPKPLAVLHAGAGPGLAGLPARQISAQAGNPAPLRVPAREPVVLARVPTRAAARAGHRPQVRLPRSPDPCLPVCPARRIPGSPDPPGCPVRALHRKCGSPGTSTL
jgi:hypothetical protein